MFKPILARKSLEMAKNSQTQTEQKFIARRFGIQMCRKSEQSEPAEVYFCGVSNRNWKTNIERFS